MSDATTREIDGLVELLEKPTDPTLHNPDLDPTGVGERTWTAFNMATLWVGMAVFISAHPLRNGRSPQPLRAYLGRPAP